MKNSTRDLWEELHKDNRFRPRYPSEIVVQYVFRNFKRDGKNKVLDLGCGAGRHVYFMAKEKIDAYGVDISSEGVEYTKKILKQDNLKENILIGTAYDIPYESEMFDGLISYGVLYYCTIAEIELSVKEIYRVLKKGGKALIVVRSIEDYRYGDGKEIEKNTFLINEEDSTKCSFNENGMIMHFFNKDEILNLFNEFKIVDIDKIDETSENGKYKDSNFIIKLLK